MRQDKHEQTNSPSSVARGMDQNLQQRACCRADNVLDVSGHEEQDNEEDGAGKCADADADDHDFGALQGGVWNF